MTEVWRDVIGYEGMYQVSDHGRIRSLKFGKERILKPDKHKDGYLIVNLYKDKISKYLIHRLVCLNFLDNPENKEQINHINGIKTDNRLINLEWVTPSENIKHAVETGLINIKGSDNGRSKLTEKDVLEIRSSNLKGVELGRIYGVDQSLISYIKRRKIWNHI
jgi:hypothetical protein